MITQETIQKIMDTARIEEVIGDFVTLKKAGSSFKGLSPFSNERTPSFMVSPAKQIFKDFSSGKGGSVVTFLMEHEQFTYPEALRFLAKKYNIEIVESGQSDEERAKRDTRESLFLVNQFANEYFQDQLWNNETGRSIGLSYFKERGFTDESIKDFQLGYSHEGYEVFTQHALDKGYQLEYLSQVGLTKVDGERKSDRFRGRVMFPILSHTGRVLGFGGRVLKKDAKTAKYLNSPESEIYHKSKILYGIYQAKQAIAKADECFLVEGYTDVVSLHQAGVKNVVASSGTALTVDQILLVKRFTRNITLLYDGDPAGIKASLRGIDLILEQGMHVQTVLFPEGEDPDSFARNNSQKELTDFLSEEKHNFLRFKASLLLSDAGNDPLSKAKAAREMVQSIALIPDELERSAYVQETARMLEMEERILFSELGQIRSAKIEKDQQRQRREERGLQEEEIMKVVEPEAKGLEDSILFVQEKALTSLLLNHGSQEFNFEEVENEYGEPEESENSEKESICEYILTELTQDDLDFEHPELRSILHHFIKVFNEEERVALPEEFLRGEYPARMHLVVDLIADEPELHDWKRKRIYPPDKDAYLKPYAMESVLRFKEKKIGQLIGEIQEAFKNGTSTDPEALATAQQLTRLKIEINKRLNRIL
ncbi:DNA primase [Croceimicrobium sp.]|uniref:DNA primase n=1 Tax=Croceimicrobium sp. TaxID=2828340 RepID=UPI003BAB95DA